MRTIQRDIVGAFIFSSDNKLLMGKGGVYAGCWLIPGGGVKPHESKLEAIIREIREETGIKLIATSIKQVEGVMTGKSEKVLRDSGEKVLVEMKFFNFEVRLPQLADQIKLITEDDFTDAQWFPIADLPTLPLSPPSIITLKKMGYL